MRSAMSLLVIGLITVACGGGAQGSAPALPGAGTSPSAAVPDGQSTMAVGSVDAAPMGYLEYLPPGYGDGEARPLLVFLHGAGEAGDGSEEALELVDDLGVPQLIEAGDWPKEHPFVVLSPQYGTEVAESDCDSAEVVAAFLDFAIGRYDVDPARVYLTGVSCGAIAAWDYLAEHGDDTIAAAVLVSGHAEWALEKASACDLASVPVWALHGELDDVVPVAHIEGPMNQIRACTDADPAEMELTVLPGADHLTAIEQAYDPAGAHDVAAWLLEHTSDASR